MDQSTYSSIIRDLCTRALWEVQNVIGCIPDTCWDKLYYKQPVWKHVYHMLHSLDQWLINPRVYTEPPIHEEGLNNLDAPSYKRLTRKEIMDYFTGTKKNITEYVDQLRDEELLEYPKGCEYTKFTLVLAQHRHLHTHMGMLMGFIVGDTDRWPMVLGLTGMMPRSGSPGGVFEK